MLDASLLNENRHVMVLVNPYEMKGDHSCLITRINITSEKPKTWLERVRSFVARKLSEMRIVYWFARIKFWLFPKGIPKSIERSMKSLRDDVYINKGYMVLYQGSEFIKERAFDAEFAFDMTGEYLKVVDQLFEAAAHYAAKGKIYMTSPIGLRFVKGSDAFLAPEYHRNVCYIDTPFLQGTIGADELIEAFQDIMFKGGGFPHWGKKNSRLSAHTPDIVSTFPKLATWKQVQKKYDPDGLFINNYTARFFLT